MTSSMVCVTAVPDGQTLAKENYEANIKNYECENDPRPTDYPNP